MKIAAKPYKTRGMVEVDQTRTNFDTIFRCGSIARDHDGRAEAPAEPLSRCVSLFHGSAVASPSRSSRT